MFPEQDFVDSPSFSQEILILGEDNKNRGEDIPFGVQLLTPVRQKLNSLGKGPEQARMLLQGLLIQFVRSSSA